jgi:formylglycine-generating enzyme required for sulfatase activity
MTPAENNFVPADHFEVLLRHALLKDEKLFNEKNIETMTPHILSDDSTNFSTGVIDNSSIVEKLVRDFQPRGNNFRLNIFLLSLFTTATITLVIFFTSREHQPIAKANSIPVVSKQNLITEIPSTVPSREMMENPIPRTNPVMIAFLDSANEDQSVPVEIHQMNNNSPSTFTSMHIPEDHSTDYDDIPMLNDADKKQIAKDKLKIMREVGKKKIYTNFPAGATNVNGVLTQVKPFGIKDAEITNFEYRTFLNDLLVQGKIDEYLLAKPVDGGWKALGINEFEGVYFVSESYNNFPACNMTRKGAELYCEWMTGSMKEAITKKDIKWSGTKMPVFRLPNNVEWIYAARACDTTIQHPWDGYTINPVQNNIGCYLCDFNYSISKDKLAPEGPPMWKNNTKGCIAAKMSTRAVVTTSGRSIDTLVACPVYSYNPNNMSLYCTLGNVSEMVWTYDPANPAIHGDARSMGGSWFSHVDNVLIEAPEQYVGITDARAYIGFRTVMILQ